MAPYTPGSVVVMDSAECLRLMATQEVGRLAVTIADQPDIFPVNYVLDPDSGSVVFRTAEGTKLMATFVGNPVAFEVDCLEPESGDAWSVVLKGRAEEIPMHELVDETAFGVVPWSSWPKSRFVRVVPAEVTGRRFHIEQRRAEV